MYESANHIKYYYEMNASPLFTVILMYSNVPRQKVDNHF